MRCRLVCSWAALVWIGIAICGRAADPARLAADEQILKDAHLASDGPALLEFFHKRTVQGADQGRLDRLIRQLGHDDFEMRERASEELMVLGPLARPLLVPAQRDPDPEVAHRARECLQNMQKGISAQVTAAAARTLAVRKPAGAVEALFAYLPFAEDETVAEEIRTALVAVALRAGKPEAVLSGGLADPSPARRAGAAVVLLQAGVAEARPAIQKLLQDPEPGVRLRVGLALASARERDAVPVLIDLLERLPVAESWPVENLLYRLADATAPTRSGGDEPARRRYREDWARWWQEHGKGVDLARAEPPKVHGYTLVMLLDEGTLLELDEQNKPRWRIKDLRAALDAQYLPGDQILIAEQGINRVSVRNLKGEVSWEKKVEEPLVAQRLANGHTFIAARHQLLEVDAEGKALFTHTLPVGELVMRAQKLPSGRIVFISSDNSGITRCFHLDTPGKEPVHSFPVSVATFGGRIEALPNGHVIVPEMNRNRVVEYDIHGAVVWQVEIEQPIVATRLQNGNLLITSMTQLRAVELDVSGAAPKQVWEYRADTRVTRAWRR